MASGPYPYFAFRRKQIEKALPSPRQRFFLR